MPAEKPLEIRLLGELELLRDGQALALPQSRKTRSLLAYLVATGRAHRRDRLCSLFWDVPDDPRGALRWSLSKLRALVDEPDRKRIVADRESVAFEAAGSDIDLLAVRKQRGGGFETAPTGRLQHLAEAFRGEFLEGLELPNCPDFQAWCVAEREEAQRLRAEILGALVDRLSPEPEAALPYARLLSQLDPYDDTSRAGLVRLLAAAGRRREAEQQYDMGCRLQTEIGGLRSDVLERAWRDVRDGVAQPAQSDGAAAHGPPPAQAGGGSEPRTDAEEALPLATSLPLPAEPSLVLLPFESPDGENDREYLAHGMTVDLTRLVSHIPSCFVIAWNSARSVRERASDIPEVARRLGVRYLLEGDVAETGGGVRLLARLHDGATGDRLWAKRFDHRREESLGVLSELAQAIAETVSPTSGRDAVARAGRKEPANPEAWDLCRRGGWHLDRGTKADLDEALAFFERAGDLDPDLCRAFSGLAEAHCQLLDLELADSAEACREAAYRAARKAVQVDTEDAAARCALGETHVMRREHDVAISAFETALSLNANLAPACHGLGAALAYSAQPREAIPHLERALRLSPLDRRAGDILERMADARLLMRDHEQAVELAERALRLPPYRWSRHAVLISALGHLDRVDEARRLLGEVLRHRPGFTLEFVREAHLFAGQVTLSHVAEPQLFVDQDEFAHYLDGLRKAGVASGTAA